MSGDDSAFDGGKLVPIPVVAATVAAIILMTCAAIWLTAPAALSWSIYRAAAAVLPREQAAALPTPASAARVPDFLLPRGDALPAALPPPDLAAATGMIAAADAVVEDPDDGVPTRILIPAIELDAPISPIGLEPFKQDGENYYRWQVPERFEAGWHNSSQPLGRAGNTVLSGHHNVHGEVFRDLVDLQPGDSVILYDDDGQFTYQVTELVIILEKGQPLEVRLENAQWIEPSDDERLTLVTCWPYDSNSHRLVVVAKPVISGVH